MKLILSLLLFSFVSLASTVEKSTLDFSISSLPQNQIIYSFKMIAPNRINSQPLIFRKLYNTSIKGKGGSKLVLAKSFMYVNKPLSFFDYRTLVDPSFNRYVTRASRIIVKKENKLRFVNNSLFSYNYDMELLYKGDEKNNINSTYLSIAKLSKHGFKGKSKYVYRVGTNFSSLGYASNNFSEYIAYGKGTIVVTYSIVAMKSLFLVGPGMIESNVVSEIQSLKRLTDAY
jgi:hypothetical protein